MDNRPLTISSVLLLSTKYKIFHTEQVLLKIIHDLQFVDYLPVQVDKPWYNYYILGYAYGYVLNNIIYFRMGIRPLTISSVWFLSTKYFILSKFYTDEGGMINLHHGLSGCTIDNPRSTVRGLSPRTGGQTVV